MNMPAKIIRCLSPIAFAAAALALIAPAPLAAQAISSLVTPRLTRPIDENSRVTLKGTVHPLASSANDRGAAPESMPLDRIQVVLKRSDAQESALKQLITDLHTPGSPSYHKWLTPDQFGKQFGPSDQDIATVEAWLQSKGFSITRLNPGRQTLEISGNVAQFREAFHTQIHKYMVEGQTHYANTTDPQIPAALAPVFGGFTSLNNFRGKNYVKVLGKATYDPRTDKATPLWTTGPGTPAIDNNYVLAPGDFAVQYDLKPLYAAGINGSGQTIAIINDSNINIYLANQFRTLFGLPANPPQVIIDGNDPGVDGINDPDGPNFDSVEAYLDVEQAGAVAPNATVDLVIAADTNLEYGLLLAAEHAVYGNVAPVISMSFGLCEADNPSLNQAFATLWEQAAAQGITVMVSSGDSGSAACDGGTYYAVNGQAVTGWGESAYNVSVGGTDFYYSSYNGSTAAINTQLGTYWNTTASNNSYTPSLKAVIPEQPWNDSQFGLDIFNILTESGGTVTSVAGGGGGASTCATLSSSQACVPYPKPSWQKGAGVPADSARDVPDLALYAANGSNGTFYPECYQDGDCQPVSAGNTVQITGIGGTSASSPAFAGIMALVNQKYGRQGQANFVLYPLATQFPAAFHDVTVGSNSEPCSFSPPSTDCISVTNAPVIDDPTYGEALEGQIGTGSMPQYNATAGYDLASGLGSVDANVLVADWNKVTFTSSNVTLTPSQTSFTHGTAITVSGALTPSTATGDVALMTDSTEPVQQGQTWFTLTNGSFSHSVNYLPGGTYNIWGHYGGDPRNAASNSQKTQVTVSPEASGIYFNLFSPAGTSNSGSIVSGATIDYGTQLLLSAQVAPSSQLTAFENCFVNNTTCPIFTPPTGTVAFADNGSTINTAVLNAKGDAEYNAPFSLGPHSLVAKYAGDNSYNSSTAAAVTFTVVKDTPALAISAANQDSNGDIIRSQPTVFNVQVANGAMITNGQNYNEAFPSPIASPTGTVTISGFPSGVPTSGTLTAAIVPGFQAQEGVTTITAPANVATGNYTVTVSYSGDANYMATSEQFPVSIIGVSGGQSSTTTATMSGSISPSSTITITGMVTGQSGQGAPTGGIIVYSSGGDITEINVNPGSGTTSSFSLTLSSQFLYQGANFITLQYTGDNTYYPSAYQLANPVLSPLSDFSIIPQTTIVPVTLGHSNTDTINLYSMNGFSGAVSFTCAGTTVTCSVPSSETLSAGGTIPLTLTINAGASVVPGSYNVLVTGKDSTGKYVHTVQVQALIASSGLQFIPVTPCRIVDTRWPTGPFGGPEMAAGTSRSFNIPQSTCGIPSTAVAYSLNVTVVPDGFLSYLTLWPTGETQPYVSTLNSDGRVKANAAITPAGTNGAVSVFVSNATNVILDIDGYFVPAGTASALAFYPVTPCRVADTRNATGPLGGPTISGGSSRSFPVQSSSCGIPATAKAYSLNVTAVPHTTLGYLTAWATGQTQPYVSTLNSSTGAVTANAAVVPAGTSGAVSIFVSDTSDVILDVNGYFAPPATGGLSLYPVTPCRVIDTRSGAGAFNGVLAVDVETSSCAPPSTAQGYVLNATVVPPSSLDYLTLWPAGEGQPYVSTLNALDGAITSNMAIVPTTNGSIDAFSSNSTNLILDISSYFAP